MKEQAEKHNKKCRAISGLDGCRKESRALIVHFSSIRFEAICVAFTI